MKAAAPSRSTGSITIGFGLITIPVKVFSAIEDSGIKRHRFTKDGHEVGMQNYDKETGDVVAYADVVTKYRTDAGELVDLTDDEIASAVGATNGQANIVAFVPWAEYGKYHAEGLMQVRPDNGKSKKTPFDKAFALLMDSMEAEGKFALIEFTLRGKPRLGALTPDGYLRVLVYENEVREARPLPSVELSEAELDMGRQLLNTLSSDSYVAVEDTASAKVRAYAETKATGVVPPTEQVEEAPAVGDLMAALAASVEAAKKSQAA